MIDRGGRKKMIRTNRDVSKEDGDCDSCVLGRGGPEEQGLQTEPIRDDSGGRGFGL